MSDWVINTNKYPDTRRYYFSYAKIPSKYFLPVLTALQET